MYPKTLIARKMRSDVERLQSHYEEWSDDLGGLCAIAAVELAIRFRKYGYKNVRAINGHLDGAFGCHCWVEVDGEVWDVTATQFGEEYDEVVRLSHKRDETFEYRVKSNKYLGLDISKREGRRLLVREWPEEQRPQSKFTRVLRGH